MDVAQSKARKRASKAWLVCGQGGGVRMTEEGWGLVGFGNKLKIMLMALGSMVC